MCGDMPKSAKTLRFGDADSDRLMVTSPLKSVILCAPAQNLYEKKRADMRGKAVGLFGFFVMSWLPEPLKVR